MDGRERRRLYEFAVSRPARWYVEHPNADRAANHLEVAFASVGSPYTPWAKRGRIRPGCPLTVRELQALGGKAAGLTSAEIADLLGVGSETVHTHFRRARRKLAAKSGAHAVAITLRDGWL